MGTISSLSNWSGRDVAGIVLGEPATDDMGRFVWDDPSIPSGTITDDGAIVLGTVGRIVAPKLVPVDAPLTADERKTGAVSVKDGALIDAGGKPVSGKVTR